MESDKEIREEIKKIPIAPMIKFLYFGGAVHSLINKANINIVETNDTIRNLVKDLKNPKNGTLITL